MPELPEVQTVVDELNCSKIHNRMIQQVSVNWAKTVATGPPERFRRQLKGCCITSIRRRGKYIVMGLSGAQYLLIHLRMTGKLYLKKKHARTQPHEHVLIRLDDGRRLAFNDTRKFGRIHLVKDKNAILGKLGPEPMSRAFTARKLGTLLKFRNRQIKPLLLDQAFIAGLGNIYVDEALWAAKIHPQRLGASLGRNEVRRLHRSIRSVLRQGLRNKGTTLGDGKGNFVSPNWFEGKNKYELKVFRKTGQACPRCGCSIQRIVVAQRSTHVCGQCQSLPANRSADA